MLKPLKNYSNTDPQNTRKNEKIYSKRIMQKIVNKTKNTNISIYKHFHTMRV